MAVPPVFLPSSVLAALGLAAAGCTGTAKACLDFAYTGETGDTGDTDPLPTTTTGPCLQFETGTDSGGSGGTGGTGTTSETGDTAAPGGSGATRQTLFERMSADSVLPPDVIERLKRQGD